MVQIVGDDPNNDDYVPGEGDIPRDLDEFTTTGGDSIPPVVSPAGDSDIPQDLDESITAGGESMLPVVSSGADSENQEELSAAESEKIQADKLNALFELVRKEYNLEFPKDDPLVRAVVIIVQMMVAADKKELQFLRDEYVGLTGQLKTATKDFKTHFIKAAGKIAENYLKGFEKDNDELVDEFIRNASVKLNDIVDASTVKFHGEMKVFVLELQEILNQVKALEVTTTVVDLKKKFAQTLLCFYILLVTQVVVILGMFLLLQYP